MTNTKIIDIELDLLLEALYRKYKYDFRGYSKASLHRRTQSALSHFNIPSISALQEKVLHNQGTFFELLQYLTVPITELFRDPNYYQAVRESVIPHLRTYPSLKFWIAGCSTGEEAYSFAILLKEEGLLDRSLIYATDINPLSLKTAQTGIYPKRLLAKYTENYQAAGGKSELKDHLEEGKEAFAFLPSLKKQILFTDHSLTTDSVFSEVHYVSCRNVLIYFDKNLQDRANQLFAESLVPKGFLALGDKESLRFSSSVVEFDPFVPERRIYRKKSKRVSV